jgi:tetratricopeptide (TPR) repeat protein
VIVLLVLVCAIAGLVYFGKWNSRRTALAALPEAEQLFQSGQVDAAAALVERYVQLQPGDGAALLLRGRIRQAQGDFAAAAVSFRAVPRESVEHRAAGLLAARLLTADGDVTAAELAMARHLRDYPDDDEVAEDLHWLYFHLFRVRDVDRLLAERLARDPDDFKLLTARIMSEFRGPVPREGLALLEAVQQRRPGQPYVLRGLAICHWQLGDLDTARLEFESALAAAPGNIEILLSTGDFLLDQNQSTLSAEVLRRIEAAQPPANSEEDRIAWLRCRVLESRGQFSEALAALEAALAVRPFDLKYRQRRGMLLQRLGRVVDAADSFRRADELSRCQMRLTEIAWAGLLQQPTPGLCREVSGLCHVRGKTAEAEAWEAWAKRITEGRRP